jgi:hypothetical protein
MEPVSLTVAALMAGVAAGVKSTMTNLATDAHEGLKALVRRRFAGRPARETALEQFPSDPDGWRSALTTESERAARRDERLDVAAQRLMALLDVEGTRIGRYRVHAPGAQGVQIGDHNIQSNLFNSPNA